MRWFCCVWLGMNVVCGVGILSTPHAVKEGGWSGLSILLIFSVLAFYTGILLRCCLDGKPGLGTYPDIGQAAFGTTGRFAVSVKSSLVTFIFLFSFLALLKFFDWSDKTWFFLHSYFVWVVLYLELYVIGTNFQRFAKFYADVWMFLCACMCTDDSVLLTYGGYEAGKDCCYGQSWPTVLEVVKFSMCWCCWCFILCKVVQSLISIVWQTIDKAIFYPVNSHPGCLKLPSSKNLVPVHWFSIRLSASK